MPYEVREQDAHGGVGRPGTPYRLSPRDPNKASPQPDPARYNVPPGKQATSAQMQFLSLNTPMWCDKIDNCVACPILRAIHFYWCGKLFCEHNFRSFGTFSVSSLKEIVMI